MIHDWEIISAYPKKEIVLQVEEIPSLEIFYSPSYKVVVRRNKRRRTDEIVSNLTYESVDVLWKDSLYDPIKHLTKLSQYAGAYATATVDKATEVKMLLKQKEDRIEELERLLHQEKSNSSEEMRSKMAQFEKYFESLKLQHQAEITEKQAQLEATTIRLQSQP